MTRYVVEHLIPLMFGALLAFAVQELPVNSRDLAEWALLLVIFFLVYSTAFEALKRYFFFILSRIRNICGLYAEIYLREPGSVVVAPYLVLHDLRSEQLRVFGRGLLVTAQGFAPLSQTATWKSTAISVSEPIGLARELAYVFDGQKDASFAIHGTTRVGVPVSASGDTSPRRGYFLDTNIKEPAFGAPEGKPFGPIRDLASHADAVRFYSIKFDRPHYKALIRACDRKRDRLRLRLQLTCEPSEGAFRRFLEKGGLNFLAQWTPSDPGPYAEIAAVLNAAVARSGSAPVLPASSPPAPTKSMPGASDLIEESG